MKRRQFLHYAAVGSAMGLLAPAALRAVASPAAAKAALDLGVADYRATRRRVDLPMGRIAVVERGQGPAALFLHGTPLNSFQWRGALGRLAAHRRCIAPDFMGLGYSQVPESQPLTAAAQVDMLVALLDALRIGAVDIVASDSGCGVAQLLLVRQPSRVRTLLFTNGDVEQDSPPDGARPIIEMARAGTLADATAKWLTDTALARSTFGAAVYARPDEFTAQTIAYYVAPLVESPLRRSQYHALHLAMEPNPLAGIEAALKRSDVPVRVVWGASDTVFKPSDAEYVDRVFPKSRGIRRVPEGKLFFQEEFPDVIAEEARRLWGVGNGLV